MSSYSLATASAASMGTLTVASHQVLMGIMTVAQFAPEPLSSCAQSNLASTQVAIHGRSEDSFGKKKHGETEKTQDLSSKLSKPGKKRRHSAHSRSRDAFSPVTRTQVCDALLAFGCTLCGREVRGFPIYHVPPP